MIFDENQSWYLDYNIQHFTTDPEGVKKLEIIPADDEGNFSVALNTGFAPSNEGLPRSFDSRFLPAQVLDRVGGA
jgi:hypothetical protein